MTPRLIAADLARAARAQAGALLAADATASDGVDVERILTSAAASILVVAGALTDGVPESPGSDPVGRAALADACRVLDDALTGPVADGDDVTAMLIGCLVSLVVAARDLDRLAGPVELSKEAAAPVVRLLARRLAAQHPGHAVELRIPPFVAVQLVEGPRHTRGTPPNVVETDAATFVDVASGRLTWDQARVSGRLSASGSRSDIGELVTALLPASGPVDWAGR